VTTLAGAKRLVEQRDEETGGYEMGCLHVVIEDSNTADSILRDCREKAVEEGDELAVRICDALLSLSDDRDRLEALGWPRDYHDLDQP
jgi:hypothetical protein